MGMKREAVQAVRTNVITSGSFQGEETYIHGKTITIGLFKKAKSYVIDEFEVLTIKQSKDHSFGGTMTGALVGSIFGPIGMFAGGALGEDAGLPKTYYSVKIRYGDRYRSTMWIDEKNYDKLTQNNKNAKPAASITITIEK